MRATRRLPRALARFGLLPWKLVPQLPEPAAPTSPRKLRV
jgi:hypothetical protein